MDIIREADAIKDQAKYSGLIDRVRRERKMEEWVRSLNADQIAEHVLFLEDDISEKEARLLVYERQIDILLNGLLDIKLGKVDAIDTATFTLACYEED
jgi:hypothetical protein